MRPWRWEHGLEDGWKTAKRHLLDYGIKKSWIAKMSVIPVFVIKDNVGQFAKDKRVLLSKDVEWSFINGANERLVSPVKERNIVLV